MFVSEGERRTLTVRPVRSPLFRRPVTTTNPPGGGVARPHQRHQEGQGDHQGGLHPLYWVSVSVGNSVQSLNLISLQH